jgi:lysozyme
MSCDARTYPFIGHHEGKVLRAYRCPAGVITIGYGCTMASRIFAEWAMKKWGRPLRLGDTIRADEALTLLKLLVDAEYLPPVEQRAPDASPHAKGAAASVSFNCGPGSLTWGWFRLLTAGKIKEAAARLRSTAVTAKGRRLPGLVRRRAEEADILQFNDWPSWLRPLAPALAASAAPDVILAQMPVEPLQSDDRNTGISWLMDLGYLSPETWRGRPSALESAVRRFQSDHAQLTVDGIMGVATLDQLQRGADVKKRMAQIAAAGGGTAGAGTGDAALDVSGYGDWLIYGGLALGLIGMIWFAVRYRDELKIAFWQKKTA